jgi:hypothetical protein
LNLHEVRNAVVAGVTRWRERHGEPKQLVGWHGSAPGVSDIRSIAIRTAEREHGAPAWAARMIRLRQAASPQAQHTASAALGLALFPLAVGDLAS